MTSTKGWLVEKAKKEGTVEGGGDFSESGGGGKYVQRQELEQEVAHLRAHVCV